MTVELESNFVLLGDRDLKSIDFDRPDVTLGELLSEIAGRAADALQFLAPGGGLDEGWEVEVNGRAFATLPNGLSTVLSDGDRVAIKVSLLGGG